MAGPEVTESISSVSLSLKSSDSMNHPPEFKGQGVVLCDVCSACQDVKFCQTCTISYCETHVRTHYTLPKLLEESLCQEHQRPLEVFCRTDQMFVCSICSATKHIGHDRIHAQSKQFEGNQHQSLSSGYEVFPPKNIKVQLLTSDSVSLSWSSPLQVEGPQTFRVTWECDWEKIPTRVKGCHLEITSLRPGEKYLFTVATEGDDGQLSRCVSAFLTTVVPPRDLNVVDVGYTSFTLHWTKGKGMETVPQRFLVSYSSPGTETFTVNTEDCHRTFSNLQPGTEYTADVVTVLNNGEESEPVSINIRTDHLTVDSVDTTSATVNWKHPPGLDQTHHQYQISYQCKGTEPHTTTTSTTSITLSNLRPATEYFVTVWTAMENGIKSQPVSTTLTTDCLESFMQKLGLTERLSLNSKLAIDGPMLGKNNAPSLQILPCYFLRELMKVNVSVRDVQCQHEELVNPLDVITALFLCSDGFLQQEMVQKMSMCQFAVPLLLPNCDTKQSTLMLWALRDIVKRYKPHSMKDPNSFMENSIVLTDLPMVSFVRLGYSTMSKSQLLNEVLSESQQKNHAFVHRNMPTGNISRKIADGLVEISWYLPSGKTSTDVFPEPVAVANLRGDIQDFQTQFSFLRKTSAAVFVFCDDLGLCAHLLKQMTNELFIVCISQVNKITHDSFKTHSCEFQKYSDNIIMKDNKMNDAQLVKKLHSKITDIICGKPFKTTVEKMSIVANELGLSVDEEESYCQKAKEMALLITDTIKDIREFKEKELPLQGETLQTLAKIEREQCRLENAGNDNIEKYKAELKEQKDLIRKKQVDHGMKKSMSHFINGLTSSTEERCHFLKWMKLNLDNLSKTNLSCLKEEYKQTQSSPNKEDLANLEKYISSSNLGIEHFLREMGQLYESAMYCLNIKLMRQDLQELPRICAQLMLDSFPLELMNGDASNIPMTWIEDVLQELHNLTKPNHRIRVITMLGVQSSGKSTLLNTMFGVQFAVSSGRCTRGAFMQLIRVKEGLKEQLGCDFIMVIDTEGLKAPELAQLADSYEHDNELATLVVGLSDITIINIAMENSTDMKDTLQIIVHAFLRMKEAGKKPMCLFVLQNVADLATRDRNSLEKKLLLEQLNEMTEVAARMERKENNTRFSDIMEYDPEEDSWYLPGLWYGNPPMAAVNAAYSEAVNELKDKIIQKFQKVKCPAHTVKDFLELTKSLWNAVKHENFIFSFHNSLEADAYSKLCVDFNKWDWTFRDHMYIWMREAETKLSNHGTISHDSGESSSLQNLMNQLKKEGTVELEAGERNILQKLLDYFKNKDNLIDFIEKYKESFIGSVKFLRRDTETSLMDKLKTVVEVKKDMGKILALKETQSNTMQQEVRKLLETCRGKKKRITDERLENMFEDTWSSTVNNLAIKGVERLNVDNDIQIQLRQNIERSVGNVHEMVNKITRLDEHGKEPFSVKKDKGWLEFFWRKKENVDWIEASQQMANNIIKQSKILVCEKMKSGAGYQRVFTRDLLKTIDDKLVKHDLQKDEEFVATLKIHVCGHASREFQKMHERFLKKNDPQRCLDKLKSQFLADFKDLYHERDQSERKAEEFTKSCLEPAIRKHVNKCLRRNILNTFLNSKQEVHFKARSFFQFTIHKHLLSCFDFKRFVEYVKDYQGFVENFILQEFVTFFSSDDFTIASLEDRILQTITEKIEKTIDSGLAALLSSDNHLSDDKQITETTDVCRLIQMICQNVDTELVIPKEALDSVLAFNKAEPEPFSEHLKACVRDIQQSLSAEYHRDTDVRAKLEKLPMKPQDELFTSMFGCRHQCPFCKAPCEAGPRGHTEHFTTLHRPIGLGTYQWEESEELTTDICSYLVCSDSRFCCEDTNEEWHSYEDFRTIYPDWLIQPDSNLEASDYWKYVFAQFNKEFAEEFDAQPADIPPGWLEITKDQAMDALNEAY